MTRLLGASATYHGFDVELRTSEGRVFYARITPDGISCYSNGQSLWGTTSEKPVELSADEIFAIISDKGEGKKFADRVGVKPGGSGRSNYSHP